MTAAPAPVKLSLLGRLFTAAGAFEAAHAPAAPKWLNWVGLVYHWIIGSLVAGLAAVAYFLGIHLALLLAIIFLLGLFIGHEIADKDLLPPTPGAPVNGLLDIAVGVAPAVIVQLWLLL